MDETYKRLLCYKIGKCMIDAVGESSFEKEVETSAMCALKKIQQIMLNDELSADYKVLEIEDVFLDFNLHISPMND